MVGGDKQSGGGFEGSYRTIFRLCKIDLIVNKILELSSFDKYILYSVVIVFNILVVRTNMFAPDGCQRRIIFLPTYRQGRLQDYYFG